MRVFCKSQEQSIYRQLATNSRSILIIFCISSSKSTSLSELSKGGLATRSLVITFALASGSSKSFKVNSFSLEMCRVLLRSGRAIKIVQATHHQGDLRYGVTTGIQCS